MAYRFTNGSIQELDLFDVRHYMDDIAVDGENYGQELQKTLYEDAEMELPEELTMIKFRYYTPDGTLLQQENVPVVYDGTGIESVEYYYLLSDKGTGITGEEEGWGDDVMTPTEQKPYCWRSEWITYTNRVVTKSKPAVFSMWVQGERGSKYLGSFYSNEYKDPSGCDEEPVTNDFYLSKTDSCIYQLVNGEWVKRDYNGFESLYKQALGDCMELAKTSGQATYAAVAFISSLFTQNLTMASGGLFKSANYNGRNTINQPVNADGYDHTGKRLKCDGSKGWAFDYNGLADFIGVTATDMVAENLSVNKGTFNNVTINESGTFKGVLNAGSVWLDNAIDGDRTSTEILSAVYDTLMKSPKKRILTIGSITFRAESEKWLGLHGTVTVSEFCWMTSFLRIVCSGTLIFIKNDSNEVWFKDFELITLPYIDIQLNGEISVPYFNTDSSDTRRTIMYCSIRF